MEQPLNVFLDFSDSISIISSMIDSDSLRERVVNTICELQDITKNASIVYYYDSREIKQIIQEATSLDECYFDDFGMRLKTVLGRTAQDISSERKINHKLYFAQWDSQSFTLRHDGDLPPTFKTLHLFDEIHTCVFSFGPSFLTETGQFHLITDSHTTSGYPMLQSYPFFSSLESISSWILAETTPSFLLYDKDKFQPTNHLWHPSKQRVYQNLQDKTYWYLDYYHKTNNYHFEVFDRCGNHLGEADETGTLDRSKMDKNKKASFLK